MQALKVPLAKDGHPADRGLVPLVAGRDALARLYVTPEHAFPPAITARIRITVDTPTGQVRAEVSSSKTVTRASSEPDLDSTINVPIPGRLVQPTTKVSATLHAAAGVEGLGPPGEPVSVPSSAARYPANGALAPLDAKPGGEPLHVTLVPIRYDADGSRRVPDVSAAQVERYRQLLYKLFPVAAVEITVHEPFPWNRRITGDRAGFTPSWTRSGSCAPPRGPPGPPSITRYLRPPWTREISTRASPNGRRWRGWRSRGIRSASELGMRTRRSARSSRRSPRLTRLGTRTASRTRPAGTLTLPIATIPPTPTTRGERSDSGGTIKSLGGSSTLAARTRRRTSCRTAPLAGSATITSRTSSSARARTPRPGPLDGRGKVGCPAASRWLPTTTARSAWGSTASSPRCLTGSPATPRSTTPSRATFGGWPQTERGWGGRRRASFRMTTRPAASLWVPEAPRGAASGQLDGAGGASRLLP